MKLQVTHHGVARSEDERTQDAFRVEQHDNRLIAALADGVGSSRAGGEAAHRAVGMMVDYFHARPQAWSARRALGEFVQQINQVLNQESLQQHGQPELLCTLSVVVIEAGMLYGLNIGDSPVYLWRKGTIRLLSQAHVLTEPGMEHVLSQAVGLSSELTPWHFEVPLEDGDMILVASDGVSNALPAPRLAELLARRIPARALIRWVSDTWEEHPEIRDDATAVVIDLAEIGRLSPGQVRSLEVIPRLEPGDRHDGFVLVRPLNVGGRVWLAKDSEGGLHTLKFAPPEAADDEGRRDAFLREIWHATRMEAPEFVHARLPSEGTLRYYILEYVDAPTLDAYLKQGRLQVEEAVALARFLLRATQFLLSRDHVHGDIKPENILVVRTGQEVRFRMIDFGSTVGLFSTTSRAGTPSYLAPERFTGSPISERSELFSIGVTLYEALTKSLPYGEIERFQTPSFELTPKRPSLRNPAVPAWLDCVTMRALSVDATMRYQSFSEMMFDLENPEQVQPLFPKDATLLVRNPLLFYKVLSALLFVCVIVLSYLLAHR